MDSFYLSLVLVLVSQTKCFCACVVNVFSFVTLSETLALNFTRFCDGHFRGMGFNIDTHTCRSGLPRSGVYSPFSCLAVLRERGVGNGRTAYLFSFVVALSDIQLYDMDACG
jgi:hypothetical protein